jgi:hypothetical protein
MEAHKNSVTIIVPAAGYQPVPFAEINSREDSGFLNTGTRLAIERIQNFYSGKPNLTILLAVNDEQKNIYRLQPYKNVRVIGVGKTSSAADTILAALEQTSTEWCLINPITAVPTSHLANEGAVYFGQDLIPKENWAALTVPSNNLPLYHPKSESASIGLNSHPFTGRVYSKTEYIRAALQDQEEEQKSDLLYLGSKLIELGRALVRFEKWIDSGHQATYAESRLYSISSRFFNSLTYSRETNTIKKVSIETIKLRLEAQMIEEAPPHIRRFFPAIVSSASKGDLWEVEMEYIGYPSLAELFLYGKLGPNTWRRIIDSLKQAYDAFYNGPALVTEEATWLYSDKTEARQRSLELILKSHLSHAMQYIYRNSYTVNGIALPSLLEVFELNSALCKQIERTCQLHIGHGDMCFNNILADPLFGTLKLIDPKAALHPATGKCGVMHGLYDLAKLNHSFIGLYDSIVNNLYHLSQSDQSTLNVEIYAPPGLNYISRLFQDRLLLGYSDEPTCTFATANLFLSMLPLHREDESRMMLMAIVGSLLLIRGTIIDLQMQS